MSNRHEPVIIIGPNFTASTWGGELWSLNDSVHVLNAEQGYVTDRNRYVLLQGSGVLESAYINTSQQLAGWWQSGDSVRDASHRWSEKIRGASIALFADQTENRLRLVTDPLGSAMLYYLKLREKTLISADLSALVQAAARAKHPLTKSLDYLAVVALTGNGGAHT